MGASRILVVLLILVHLIAQSECNQSIFDIYFNGHCYWSEDVSYHVHFSSGCKVYFTCQRGKFLEFKRCPDSTIFNIETLQCDANAYCIDDTSVNPTYDAWWKTVVEVIDDVLEALENNSTSSSKDIADTFKNNQDESIAILSSSTIKAQMLTKTDEPLIGSIDLLHKDNEFFVDEGMSSEISGSVAFPTEPKSTFDATEDLDSTNTDASSPVSTDKPQLSAAKIPENDHSSVHIVSMQSETQTLLKPESFSSYVTPKALPQEDISKTYDQLNLSYMEALAFSSNSTKGRNFMTDLIFPLARDIVRNSTIMSKVTQLFDVLLESAPPVVYRILDQQVDEKLGSPIKISLKELKDAWNRTTYLACPIVKEIARNSMHLVFERAAENSDVLLDFLDEVDDRISSNIPSIFVTLLDLVYKYRLLDKPSIADQLKNFSLLEIRKDMKDVSGILSNILGEKPLNFNVDKI